MSDKRHGSPRPFSAEPVLPETQNSATRAFSRRAMLKWSGASLAAAGAVLGDELSGAPAAHASAANPASAATTPASTYPALPTFTGTGATPEPVPFTLNGMMQAIHAADVKRGAYWIDDMLARRGGADPSGLILLSRGRAAWMRSFDVAWGFAGDLAYVHSISGQDGYSIVSDQGFAEDPTQRVNRPSHFQNVWTNGSVTATQNNFITWNDSLVTTLKLANSGSADREFSLIVKSPYAATADGSELVGTVSARGLTTVNVRIAASGFSPVNGQLARTVTVPAGQTVAVKVVMGLITDELPESALEYAEYVAYSPDEALSTHVAAYNQWWADAIPYIDIPDPYLKKLIYYQWWLVRFNQLDAELESVYRYPTHVEGALGYDNAISNSVNIQIQDSKWLRTPLLPYATWLSMGATSAGGAYIDNPGSANWHEVFNQFLTKAGWDAVQVHGADKHLLRLLAGYARDDVAGQLAVYDSNHNYLLEYNKPEPTGIDSDALSFFYTSNPMDRTESAYVWWNAQAAAAMWESLGDGSSSRALLGTSAQIRTAILARLWNSNARAFQHRDIVTGQQVPWKEIQNFFPFTAGLVPNDANYLAAFDYWTTSGEFSIFPPYYSDQKDRAAAEAAGKSPTDNFGPFGVALNLNFLSSTIRSYPGSGVGADAYKTMLYWGGWLNNANGDADWPDTNEFLNSWNAQTGQIDYRSWIHHDFLGNYNWTFIEDVAGLRPRIDTVIELDPIDIGWGSFTFDQIPYHGQNLTITWAGSQSATGKLPVGYSLFVNGTRVLTVDRLAALSWDSATGRASSDATVLYSRRLPIPHALDVTPQGRVLEQAAKAGAGSGAWVRLRSQASDAVLSVQGQSLAENAALITRADTGDTDQQWRLIDQRNGTVVIKNRKSSAFAAVSGNTVTQTRERDQATAWSISDHADGLVQLRTPGTGASSRYLGAGPGGALVLSPHPSGTTTQWRVLPNAQTKLQNGYSNKVLALPPRTNIVGPGSGAVPSASYTNPGDDVTGPLTNTTGAATPRWTCWNSLHASDWYQVTLATATAFDTLALNFYDDEGGVLPPSSFTVEARVGGSWTAVSNVSSYPAQPAAGPNTVTFAPVTADGVRITFVNENPVSFGQYTGLVGLQLYSSEALVGKPVIQAVDDGSNDHLWEFVDAGSGDFQIRSVGAALDLSASGQNAVTLAQSSADQASRWRLAYAADGYFGIVNRATGKSIGISSDSLIAGASAAQLRAGAPSAIWAIGTSGT